MKKFYFFALALFTATAMSVGLASCSDDDDKKGPQEVAPTNLSAESTVIMDADGVPYRVASYGNYYYTYDESGLLAGIEWRTNYWNKTNRIEVSATPFVISEYYEDNGEQVEMKSNISMNGQGLVGGITTQYTSQSKYYTESETETSSFQYNDAKQLTKVTTSGIYTDNEDGETYSGSWSGTAILTWENGNLTKITCNATEIEDGEKDSESWTYTFTYGTRPNTSKQWLDVMRSAMSVSDSETEFLAPLGLFGHGPAYFPTSYESNDGSTSTYTLSYTQNSNGTISSDDGTTYTYDKESADAIKAKAPQSSFAGHKRHIHKMHHHVFKHQ